MRFAIDGYNLLFALGKLTRASGKSALDGARKWLLALVHAGHTPDDDVTVVFDGKPGRAGHGAGAEFSHGVEADDVIEDRIRRETVPGRLTVVSDDRRLREAARRKGCHVLRCLDYYDKHLTPKGAPADPEPTREPADDRQSYIDLFKHLDDDPELGDPF